MATRKAPTKLAPAKKAAAKKSATTKSAATKSTATKSAAKRLAKPTPGTGDVEGPIIIPNLSCIIACAGRFGRCLQNGVDRATCEKRLRRCIMNCAGIRGAGAADVE